MSTLVTPASRTVTAQVKEYQGSPENQRDFDKWLNSNAILSSVFAIGVLAMAVTAIVVPYHRGQDVAAVVPTSMSGE